MKQGIHETSAVQLYPIGKRIALGESVYRYCRAKEALNKFTGAFCGGLPHPGGSDWYGIAAALLIPAYPIGATLIDFPCNDAVDLNALAGGYFTDAEYGTPATSRFQWCRIKSNLASVGTPLLGAEDEKGGAIVKITLEDPLYVAILAGDSCTVYENIYHSLTNTEIDNRATPPGPINVGAAGTVVCVPMVDVGIGEYFWGLTWGPTYGVAGNADGRQGAINSYRTVYFDVDGLFVYRQDGNEAADAQRQAAGIWLFNTAYDRRWRGTMAEWAAAGRPDLTEQSDPVYMLQISP